MTVNCCHLFTICATLLSESLKRLTQFFKVSSILSKLVHEPHSDCNSVTQDAKAAFTASSSEVVAILTLTAWALAWFLWFLPSTEGSLMSSPYFRTIASVMFSKEFAVALGTGL